MDEIKSKLELDSDDHNHDAPSQTALLLAQPDTHDRPDSDPVTPEPKFNGVSMTITLHWSLIPVLFFMWCILSNTPRTAIRNYCDNHSQHQDSLLPTQTLCSLLTQYSPHFPTTASSTLASSCHHDRAWAHSKTKPVKCPARVPARNIGPEFDPEQDQEYVKLAINRLQGAVRIVSSQNRLEVHFAYTSYLLTRPAPVAIFLPILSANRILR